MPPIRRSKLGRCTRRAIISQNVRDNQTQEERAEENKWRREHIAQVHAQIRQNVELIELLSNTISQSPTKNFAFK